MGPRPFGVFIATEINHDENLGFGPWTLGPRGLRVGPEWLGLLIATEINHDENLEFGSRSLGPTSPQK